MVLPPKSTTATLELEGFKCLMKVLPKHGRRTVRGYSLVIAPNSERLLKFINKGSAFIFEKSEKP